MRKNPQFRNGEWKSDPESGIGSPPKVYKFFRLKGQIKTPSFNEIGSSLLRNDAHTLTDRMKERLTERMTDKPTWSYYVNNCNKSD